MKVLSLGWGVQSFTLAAMSALGELPKLDAAVHADTTYERESTYQFRSRWEPWLQEHGIRILTTQSDNVDILRYGTIIIPAFAGGQKGGFLRRACTTKWKIAPARRVISTLLKEQHLTKTVGIVELWMGISVDEVLRMKDSNVKYIKHSFPLIAKMMSRTDCKDWLLAHHLEIPPKSSCVFCPFHEQAAWQSLHKAGGTDWQKALEVDSQVRKARPPFDMYIHYKKRPLLELVQAETEPEVGLKENECSGVCFV